MTDASSAASTSLIIGAAVGGGLLLLLCIVLIFTVYCRRYLFGVADSDDDLAGAADIAQWQKTIDGEIQFNNCHAPGGSSDYVSLDQHYRKAALGSESMRISANPMRTASMNAIRNSDASALTEVTAHHPTSAHAQSLGTVSHWHNATHQRLSSHPSSPPPPRTSMVPRMSIFSPFMTFMRIQAEVRSRDSHEAVPRRETIVRQNLVTSAISNLVSFLRLRSAESKRNIVRYGVAERELGGAGTVKGVGGIIG